MMYRPVRWRWGLGGLLIGIAYVLADLLLEWRGPRYLPWGGEGTISNVTQMLTGISLIFLIAFAIGYAKDRRALQGK
jgi:hypothetical protein